MKNTSQSGFVLTSLAVKIALAVALFLGGVFVAKKFVSHNEPSKAEVALNSEKSSAAKSGQQLAAATTKEVALAKDQSDPAIVAARKTSARADVALQTGLGALTPEQAQWVQNLVEADAAGFASALASKDEQIAQTGNKISELEKKVSAEREHSGLLEKLLIAAGVAFIFINYVLPWLEKLFPPLAIFISAIHAVLNPFLSALKAKAQEDVAAAEAKASKLVSEVGAAVTSMRAKLGGNAGPAIEHLSNNLSDENADAVASAAKDHAAAQAAQVAAAQAAVQIASN